MIVGYFFVKQSITNISDAKPKLAAFPLENIDIMRKKILGSVESYAPFIINNEMSGDVGFPYQAIHNRTDITEGEEERYVWSIESNQEGLAVKTYQSDLFQNWLNTEAIDGENGVNEVTAIIVEDNKIKVDRITAAYKVYQMLNAINLSRVS